MGARTSQTVTLEVTIEMSLMFVVWDLDRRLEGLIRRHEADLTYGCEASITRVDVREKEVE